MLERGLADNLKIGGIKYRGRERLEPYLDSLFPVPDIDVERRGFAPVGHRRQPRVSTLTISFKDDIQRIKARYITARACHPGPSRIYVGAFKCREHDLWW